MMEARWARGVPDDTGEEAGHKLHFDTSGRLAKGRSAALGATGVQPLIGGKTGRTKSLVCNGFNPEGMEVHWPLARASGHVATFPIPKPPQGGDRFAQSCPGLPVAP